ncbi:MAG: 3-oxoacyl-ACP reductase FabG [Rhodocyclaceae bacterium]|nr:3-oxoacyl-ACP reductase FabG [Rhodocyclaceae bacterium]MBK9956277.1 3-oxoacyl-ACP reductase FabG [Rhodocyclaceae bacterium]
MMLVDRVAVVTGAAQGIGAAVAAAYVKEGARVVIADLDGAAAAATAKQLGNAAIGVACNVGERASVDAMVTEAVARLGHVDILVNNAGITRTAMLHKMTMEQWQAVVNVHLTGTFNCTQAVVGGMMERRWGRIINVTSAAGLVGTIGQVNYSAAKAGILGFTKSCARELARHGIVVNAIAPGAATPMTEVIRTDDRFKEKYLERIPMGRWAEPEEVTPAFVFFASPGASYVTGQILSADGGLSIH